MYPNNVLTEIPKPERTDYNKDCTHLGGKVSEFNPVHRRFPGPRKREVSFSAIRFPGYPHYHLTLEEQHNEVFAVDDAGKRYWVKPWHDEEGKGKKFNRMKTASLRRAHRWAQLKFSKEFNPKTHRLVFDNKGLERIVKQLLKQGD